MDKASKRILKIKAALWESRNEDRLLSKAIRAYRDPEADRQPRGETELIVSGKTVTIRNIPLIEKDGELYENLHLTATLEEVLQEMYGDLPPSEVDFDELLK